MQHAGKKRGRVSVAYIIRGQAAGAQSTLGSFEVSLRPPDAADSCESIMACRWEVTWQPWDETQDCGDIKTSFYCSVWADHPAGILSLQERSEREQQRFAVYLFHCAHV